MELPVGVVLQWSEEHFGTSRQEESKGQWNVSVCLNAGDAMSLERARRAVDPTLHPFHSPS